MALSPTRRLAVCLSVLLSLALAAAPPPDSPQERNKAVARRVFEDLFNHGRFAAAAEIYAPGFQNHGLHGASGLAEDQAALQGEVGAFPDLRMTVEQVLAEGDLVSVLWTFRGTHTDWGYGLPPTGARVEMRGITHWRMVDGRIRDEWTEFDALGAYTQVLGHLKWFLAVALVAGAGLGYAAIRLLRRWRRRRA